MFQSKSLMMGFQGRNSRQETGDGSVAEAMGEYCLLAYSRGFSACFLIASWNTCPWWHHTKWTHSYQTIIRKMHENHMKLFFHFNCFPLSNDSEVNIKLPSTFDLLLTWHIKTSLLEEILSLIICSEDSSLVLKSQYKNIKHKWCSKPHGL